MDAGKVLLQVGVRVRIAVRKVAGVFAVWELKCPGEREIVAPVLPRVVPVILDLVSYSLPANIMSLGLFFRIKEWAHAPAVKTRRLGEIDNSEPVDYSCLGISDLEVVPLGVLIGEEVGAHRQLVFVVCPNTQKRRKKKARTMWKMTSGFK